MSKAGLNLKYLRKLRGWTQEEFANKLNIKRSLIGAYEEERADPRIEVLETVASMFKLTLDELLLKDLSNSINTGSYLQKRRMQKKAVLCCLRSSDCLGLLICIPKKQVLFFMNTVLDLWRTSSMLRAQKRLPSERARRSSRRMRRTGPCHHIRQQGSLQR